MALQHVPHPDSAKTRPGESLLTNTNTDQRNLAACLNGLLADVDGDRAPTADQVLVELGRAEAEVMSDPAVRVDYMDIAVFHAGVAPIAFLQNAIATRLEAGADDIDRAIAQNLAAGLYKKLVVGKVEAHKRMLEDEQVTQEVLDGTKVNILPNSGNFARISNRLGVSAKEALTSYVLAVAEALEAVMAQTEEYVADGFVGVANEYLRRGVLPQIEKMQRHIADAAPGALESDSAEYAVQAAGDHTTRPTMDLVDEARAISVVKGRMFDIERGNVVDTSEVKEALLEIVAEVARTVNKVINYYEAALRIGRVNAGDVNGMALAYSAKHLLKDARDLKTERPSVPELASAAPVDRSRPGGRALRAVALALRHAFSGGGDSEKQD
jgi:hypothetical protein